MRAWVRKEVGHRAEKDLVDIQDLKDAVASYVGMVTESARAHSYYYSKTVTTQVSMCGNHANFGC